MLKTVQLPNKKNGALAYVITDIERHMVLVMAANGLNQTAIGAVLDISIDTLRSHFPRELERGKDYVTAQLGAVIVEAGLNGNITAAKYWLSNHCKEWRQASDATMDPPDRDDNSTGNEIIRFYLPSNKRDIPEGPTIDGKAEDE